ncbi:MAG: FHA domain-containing protein [Planctomycetota bacterium]
MDSPQTIRDFISKHEKIPEHFFLGKYKKPFLVVSMPIDKGVFEDSSEKGAPGKGRPSGTTGDGKDESLMVTLVIHLAEDGSQEKGKGFSIGRGSENDIVLFHPSVSNHHATIEEDRLTGEYWFADRGSSYGTELNGKAVQPHESYPVSDGSALLLGKAVFCTFMAPRSFFRFMMQRIEKGEGS